MYRYPDYVFYGDAAVAQSAQLNSRYGTESLKGVLLDIHFLSLCDYLVCTFSSQVKKRTFLSIKIRFECEI
jgi:glycoprotein 6-alpha-L-fucosyltransferase